MGQVLWPLESKRGSQPFVRVSGTQPLGRNSEVLCLVSKLDMLHTVRNPSRRTRTLTAGARGAVQEAGTVRWFRTAAVLVHANTGLERSIVRNQASRTESCKQHRWWATKPMQSKLGSRRKLWQKQVHCFSTTESWHSNTQELHGWRTHSRLRASNKRVPHIRAWTTAQVIGGIPSPSARVSLLTLARACSREPRT